MTPESKNAGACDPMAAGCLALEKKAGEVSNAARAVAEKMIEKLETEMEAEFEKQDVMMKTITEKMERRLRSLDLKLWAIILLFLGTIVKVVLL